MYNGYGHFLLINHCVRKLEIVSMRQYIILIIIISLPFILSISANQQSDQAIDQDSDAFALPPYARFLKGYKICLDPGHGGQGHIPDYKRGPTGLREAEINLKVAFYLRKLLEKAEATVLLTREDDSYVSLARRSEISNENGADFFISIHHNGLDNNPEINFTSTWYHGDADESRPSLDLARYIQQGVSNALRLPKSPPTGLYSDKLVVSSGFGVLRLTNCPAVVCEASFYTHPEEETRLRNDDYLKKEAYGYFLGIARYVEAGFPHGTLITPVHKSVIQTKTPTLKLQVNDGIHERGAWILKRQQIYTNTIQVKINDVLYPFNYDRETDIITVKINEPLSNGIQNVQTEMVNYYGNHSLPNPQQFKVAPPAVDIQLVAWTDTLPTDSKCYVGIKVSAQDIDKLPIADGELIRAKTSKGTLAKTEKLTHNGVALFYLYAPDKPGNAIIHATYGKNTESININFSDTSYPIVQGQVTDGSTEMPISDVLITAKSKLTAVTDKEGHYFIKTGTSIQDLSNMTLRLSKAGYYPKTQSIQIEQNKASVINHKLYAIADRAFTASVIVLDTTTDTDKTNQLITKLKEMLELAGAKIYVVHERGLELSTEERIKKVNSIKDEGFYLQINHYHKTKDKHMVIAKHNRGNQDTETFQKRILEQFNGKLYKTPITTVQDRETPIIQQTNKMAMTLDLQSLGYPNSTVGQEASAIFMGIWLYAKEATEIDTEKLKRFMEHYNQTRGE